MVKNNIYVGQRYVPKIMGEWNQLESYEGLSIVTNQGNSYTSKKRVPEGVDISNEDYWVITGNYNAQIELYREEVKQQKEHLENFEEETNRQSVNGANLVSLTAYPRISPEISDSGRLQRALDEATDGVTFFLADKKTYEITQSLIINDKKVTIVGQGATLKVMSQGLDNVINATNSPGFKVMGVNFDQSLVGRTSINITNCPDFLISFCEFTGYSKEYGYYVTDGGIRVSQTNKGRILFNKWKDHGYQYDNNDLNRCITIQANSDNILLMGNTFENVNQGVVIDGGSHIITANSFKNVKDNSLYLINVNKVVVGNNTFDDKFDECIVLNGKTVIIDGNSFKDSPNKFIALNGNLDNLIINGNDFETTEGSNGKFISWRNSEYLVKSLKVNGNRFKNSMTTVDDINTEYFEIGNVDHIDFSDNDVDVTTGEFQRMLFFKGTRANGKVTGNRFKGTIDSAKTIELAETVSSGNILYDDNEHVLCRGIFYERLTVRNQEIITNIGPYISSRSRRQEVSMATMPTKGYWKKGDVCWNIGNDHNVICWRRMTDGSTNVLDVDWKQL